MDRMRSKVLAGVLAGAVAGALVGTPAAGAASTASLEVVGKASLDSRGMNSALAVAGACAYVGSRADAAPLVVDISNPAALRVTGALTRHAGSTPRELRAVPAANELVVLYYNLSGGSNGLDLYRWTADCKSPALAGHYDFGSRAPHEFYLWQDPARPSRVLLYVSMFGASGDGLDVIDISDPARPVRSGGWAVPAAYGHAPLHSIDISADGRTAYVSLWTGGLVVADSSDFASGGSNPTLKPATPPSGAYKTLPGDVHSAVPLVGRSMVLTTDERYPSPYGQGCPFGVGHVVDVSNPAAPRAIGTLAVPENAASACAAAAKGTWTSHNPTLTAHLALVSWYSAGLQVFSLDDPANPVRLAELRPSGVTPALRDLQLGTTDAMTWSYPVISSGLVYVVDINQGLLVLRYHGPHEDEVAGSGFTEGNSNIAAATAATPGASAGATPSSGSTTTGSPAPAVSSSPASTRLPIIGGLAVLVLAGLTGGIVILMRRRRR